MKSLAVYCNHCGSTMSITLGDSGKVPEKTLQEIEEVVKENSIEDGCPMCDKGPLTITHTEV